MTTPAYFDIADNETYTVRTADNHNLGQIFKVVDGEEVVVSRAFGRTPETSSLVQTDVYTRCFEGPVVRLWKDETGDIFFSSTRGLNAETQTYCPGETFGELFLAEATSYLDSVFIKPGETHLFMLANMGNTVSIRFSFGRNRVVFLGVMNLDGKYTPSFDITDEETYQGCYVPQKLVFNEAERVFEGYWNQTDAVLAYKPTDDGGYSLVKCISPGTKLRGDVCSGAPDVYYGLFRFLTDYKGYSKLRFPKFFPDGSHFIEGYLSEDGTPKRENYLADSFKLMLFYRECVSTDKRHLIFPAYEQFLDTKRWMVDFIHNEDYRTADTGNPDLNAHIHKRASDIAGRAVTRSKVAGFVASEFGASVYKFFQARIALS
jgi:hypothetical protein